MASSRTSSGWFDCVKHLLLTFNLLFWLFGCTGMAIGIWIAVDPSSLLRQSSNRAFENFINQADATFRYQFTGAYILIAVGATITVVGFIGCFAALQHSICLLGTFFVTLLCIFFVLMASGLYAVWSTDKMEDQIRDRLIVAVRHYNNDTNSKSLMDFLQSNFKCCGATSGGVSDYQGHAPESCANYNVPCPVSVYYELAPNFIIIAGVAIGIAAVLLIGMFFSLSLCCHLIRHPVTSSYAVHDPATS